MTQLEPEVRIQKSLTAGRARVLSELNSNPALVLTLTYILVSGIGLAYSWRLLGCFGVNILYFADIQDFLVAAVRRPISIGLVVLVFGLMFVAVNIDFWLRKTVRWYNALYRSPRLEAASYNIWVILVLITLTAGLYVFEAADREARHIREGDGVAVEVQFIEESGLAGLPGDGSGARSREEVAPVARRLLVASTSRYVFLYDRAAERLEIVPSENIAVLRPWVDAPVKAPARTMVEPQADAPAAATADPTVDTSVDTTETPSPAN